MGQEDVFPPNEIGQMLPDPARYPQDPVIVSSFKGYGLGTPTRMPQLFCTVCACKRACVCAQAHMHAAKGQKPSPNQPKLSPSKEGTSFEQ